MIYCNKCGSTTILSSLVEFETQSGNDLYLNQEFSKIKVGLQIDWCAKCGESSQVDVFKLKKL